MPQLNAYIDQITLAKIELAAKFEHLSVSKWVKNHLITALQETWPQHYADLLGSLKETRLERPDQGNFANDIAREKI